MMKKNIYIKEILEYKRFKKAFRKAIPDGCIINDNAECIYRNIYYDDRNRYLVELCKKNDINGIVQFYKNIDSDNMYYDEYFENRMSMRIIAKYIERNIARGEHIIDIACGHGSIDKYLTKKGYKITGIDFNPDRIKEIKKYIYDAQCTDIENIDKDRKYNILISLEMLEHVPDIKKTLSNMYMILNRGGVLSFQFHMKG